MIEQYKAAIINEHDTNACKIGIEAESTLEKVGHNYSLLRTSKSEHIPYRARQKGMVLISPSFHFAFPKWQLNKSTTQSRGDQRRWVNTGGTGNNQLKPGRRGQGAHSVNRQCIPGRRN